LGFERGAVNLPPQKSMLRNMIKGFERGRVRKNYIENHGIASNSG